MYGDAGGLEPRVPAACIVHCICKTVLCLGKISNAIKYQEERLDFFYSILNLAVAIFNTGFLGCSFKKKKVTYYSN